MLSSLWRPWLLAAPPARSRSASPLVLHEAAPGPRLRISGPASRFKKGILQHDREFQPPRYLRIGQLMVSAEPFSIGEVNTI